VEPVLADGALQHNLLNGAIGIGIGSLALAVQPLEVLVIQIAHVTWLNALDLWVQGALAQTLGGTIAAEIPLSIELHQFVVLVTAIGAGQADSCGLVQILARLGATSEARVQSLSADGALGVSARLLIGGAQHCGVLVLQLLFLFQDI